MAQKSKNGKKKSPNSIPATQQDVQRAEERGLEQGRMWGVEWATNLFMFILRDKHDASDEELDVFKSEVDEYLDLINRGEVNCRDVKGTLKFEYNTEVRFT